MDRAYVYMKISEYPPNIEIQNFGPKKWTEPTYIWKYQITPPPPPPWGYILLGPDFVTPKYMYMQLNRQLSNQYSLQIKYYLKSFIELHQPFWNPNSWH